MSGTNPKVTVLMPVYNGEKYLRPAIESILNQSFTDFEFLIINDGSTDSSVKIIESYNDPRIRLIHNDHNLKLIATLNKGFELARGEYLARMDCDDVSLPDRLLKQVNFMVTHPEVGICGTRARVITQDGTLLKRKRLNYPAGYSAQKYAWRPSPIIHPTAFIRNSVFKKFKYDPNYIHAEDYELWMKASRETVLYNLKEYLFLYRIHSTSITSTNKITQLKNSYRAFNRYFGNYGLTYEEFLSFMFACYKLNPVRRIGKCLDIINKGGMSPGRLVYDTFKYTVFWFQNKLGMRGNEDEACQ